MSTFMYKCNFCSSEMEYDDSDQFCCVCGNAIDFKIQNMQNESKKLINQINKLKKENEYIKATYNDENIWKTIIERNKYANICEVIAHKKEKEISSENKYTQNRINDIIKKLKEEGHTGTNIFELDSLYKYSWYKFCKRLYPSNNKSRAISPEHTYNAYICNNNKRDFVGADIFIPLNIMFKNNTILKKDDGINILLFSYDNNKADKAVILPSFNMNLYGFENYKELFDFEYSKNNVNEDELYYMVKKRAIANDKGNYFELIKKGVITFMDKAEYDNMCAYYNDIINRTKRTASSKKFNYYDMLDKMYEKYKNK